MPDSAEAALAAIGHNQPPPEELASETESRVAKLIETTNAWLAQCKVIATEQEASRCEDLIAQLRAEWEAVDAEREILKRPHLDAANRVQAAFKPLLDRIAACGLALKPLKAKWLALVEQRQQAAAEDARKKAEALERDAKVAAQFGSTDVEAKVSAEELQRQAQDAAAQAERLAAAKPQVAGSLSGRASGFTTFWRAEITDPRKVGAHYVKAGEPKLLELLQKLADADARRLHERFRVPGAEAKEDRRV